MRTIQVFFALVFLIFSGLPPAAATANAAMLTQANQIPTPTTPADTADTATPDPVIPIDAALPGDVTAVSAVPACQWGYYPGGAGSWTALFTDPDGTTPSALRFGTQFATRPTKAASGLLDFNGDNQADVFRIALSVTGYHQWQYSNGGVSPWADLAIDARNIPLTQILFGDFNGDGKTDVLSYQYIGPLGVYEWYLSYSGTATPTLIRSSLDKFPISVGDYNGDGAADAFGFIPNSPYAGAYRWQYFPNGSGNAILLAYDGVSPYDLRMGDFNGDGTTDVFSASPLAGGDYQWLFSSGGALSYEYLALTQFPVSVLNLGDLNGDGKTDVFSKLDVEGMNPEWHYWDNGLGYPNTLRYTPDAAPFLGSFNNDSITDAFQARCAPTPLFTEWPTFRQPLAEPSANYTLLAMDVDGNQIDDLVASSLCQGTPGVCATRQNWISGGLVNPLTKTIVPIPNQILQSGNWGSYRTHSGDFDNDSKQDLIFNTFSNIDNWTFVVRWNGTSFVLSDGIGLGGGFLDMSGSVGDFNGDGKTDLVWSSSCVESLGGCTIWQTKNSLYTGLSSGSGLQLSALQNFAAFPISGQSGFVMDSNGDGNQDIVWTTVCGGGPCTSDTNTLYIALANGLGGFTMQSPQSYGTGWFVYNNGKKPLLGDFNGDGRGDMAWLKDCSYISVCNSTYTLRVALSQANGSYLMSSPFSFGLRNWDDFELTTGDLDGDGRIDLLWYTGGTSNFVSSAFLLSGFSNGDGTFRFGGLEQINSPTSNPVTYLDTIRTGDFNGDNRTDLVWHNRAQTKIIVSASGSKLFLPYVKK